MGACGVKIEVEYLIFYFLVDTVDGRGIFYERRVVSQKKTIELNLIGGVMPKSCQGIWNIPCLTDTQTDTDHQIPLPKRATLRSTCQGIQRHPIAIE